MDESRAGASTAAPTVDYFRNDVTGEWLVIASLPNAGLWHAANALLNRNGITCRMGGRADETEIDLLVLSTEAEWARDVLSKGMPQLDAQSQSTGGFPVITATDASEEVVPISAVPVGRADLSRRQRSLYTVTTILLWIVLVGLIAMLLVPLLFSLVK
jgi:hypothetical protein